MPNIRMIWFDIGNVLFRHNSDWRLVELAKMFSPAMRPHEIFALIRKSDLVRMYDLGNISTKEFIGHMKNLLHFTDEQRFFTIWQKALVPDAFIWQIVSVLRNNGYPLGIISDTNEMHIEYLERVIACGQMMQFHPKIYSCRERIGKPAPEVFERAVGRANTYNVCVPMLAPEECIFIDDLAENVKAAESAGWHAIHYNPAFHTPTLSKLAELGVRI